ncbi:MAG TPA: response regulator transcription factor [Burkholderiales bacterium]|nr:response regulator transcription factor [Burkholderiales bacterium]
MTIRILIADDHTVVAEGLKHLIEAQSDLEVVAIVGDGREAVRIAKEAAPQVVLMDLSMPELNGADATRAIVENDPKCRVIMLSMYAEREYVRRALKAGASGYVLKRSAAEEVVAAIRAVHGGSRYLSPRVADAVIDDVPADEKADLLERLSAREREVLQLLAEGRTGAEIAQRLSLSQKTVETYRARLVEKLGIRDVAGLVKFAIQRGLVSLD